VVTQGNLRAKGGEHMTSNKIQDDIAMVILKTFVKENKGPI
jgi:hypothetical protein